MFLPERYTTTLTNTLNGYIGTGYATAAAGNFCDFMVNSIASPFYGGVSYPFTSGTGVYSWGFHGSLVQGDVLSQASIGYQSLAGLYTNYKVHSYKVTVTVQPATAADPTVVSLIPIGGEEIPSTSAAQVDCRVMCSQPLSASKLCASGVPPSSNTLVIAHRVSDTLGLRQQQWLDMPPSALNATPTYPCYAGLFLQETNGSNNSAPISVMIVLEQVVEFSDLIQQYA